MKCNSCQMTTVNGIPCHEQGCPDAWMDEVRDCKWCGTEFRPHTPHQHCCSNSCECAYQGIPFYEDDGWLEIEEDFYNEMR